MKKEISTIILIFVFLVAFPYFACSNSLPCDSIPGLENLLQSGQIVLFGEIHGTNQLPQLISTLSKCALEKNLIVTIGLELPSEQQKAVDKYLESDGKADDIQALIKGDFWQGKYQDGRRSRAMLRLIDDIRVMRKAKNDRISILLIDNQESQTNRDQFMAQTINKAFDLSPKKLFLVLTGNMHNQIVQNSQLKPMGVYLTKMMSKDVLISIDIEHAGGSAWVASTEGCGVISLSGESNYYGCYMYERENDKPRTGVFYIGKITPSYPAKDSSFINPD